VPHNAAPKRNSVVHRRPGAATGDGHYGDARRVTAHPSRRGASGPAGRGRALRPLLCALGAATARRQRPGWPLPATRWRTVDISADRERYRIERRKPYDRPTRQAGITSASKARALAIVSSRSVRPAP
jgi:hypothetical protein